MEFNTRDCNPSGSPLDVQYYDQISTRVAASRVAHCSRCTSACRGIDAKGAASHCAVQETAICQPLQRMARHRPPAETHSHGERSFTTVSSLKGKNDAHSCNT